MADAQSAHLPIWDVGNNYLAPALSVPLFAFDGFEPFLVKLLTPKPLIKKVIVSIPPAKSACELASIPVKFKRSGILLNGTLFGLQFASVGRLTRTGEPEIARQKGSRAPPIRRGKLRISAAPLRNFGVGRDGDEKHPSSPSSSLHHERERGQWARQVSRTSARQPSHARLTHDPSVNSLAGGRTLPHALRRRTIHG